MAGRDDRGPGRPGGRRPGPRPLGRSLLLWPLTPHWLARRQWRVAFMALATVAAAVVWTLLGGGAEQTQATIQGQPAPGAPGSYQILVRPANSRTSIEASGDLVRPNAWQEVYGGITLAQAATIARLPGVQVAAPIAMLGYVMRRVTIPVPITGAAGGRGPALYAGSIDHVSDRGLSQVEQPDVSYAYITPQPLAFEVPRSGQDGAFPSPAGGAGPAARAASPVCPQPDPSATADPYSTDTRRAGTCWTSASGQPTAVGPDRSGPPAVEDAWTFPLLLVAVDPAAEAALDGMNGSVTSGSYLPETASADGAIPVIAADSTPDDDRDVIAVRQLPAADAKRFGTGLPVPQINAMLDAAAGAAVTTATVTAQQAYQALLSSDLTASGLHLDSSYWTPSPVAYSGTAGHLAVKTAPTPAAATWRDPVQPGGAVQAPLDSSDTAVRSLTAHTLRASVPTGTGWPILQTVGTYDPRRIRTVPDEPGAHTWVPAALPGANKASRQLLRNQPLTADASLTGYPADVPSLVMPLADIGSLTSSSAYSNITSQGAPVSAIRVRVAGVTGTDAMSRVRVQTVADEISRQTGLDIDVTYGATPVPVTITLPAGQHGRPALQLTETWYRKNMRVEFLSSVDRRTSTLLILVLLVCGVMVANARTSMLRGERHALRALSHQGWSRAAITRFLAVGVVAEGLTAGLLAATLSWPLSPLVRPRPDLSRIGLAVPLGLGIACLTAAWPVWRAARDATADTRRPSRPGAAVPRRGRPNSVRLRGVASLAFAALLDTPLRTAAATVAVAVGTAAATLQIMLIWYWHGAVVGSLASHPFAVENRAADAPATAALLLLAAAAVGDVVRLGVSERRQQLAGLTVLGWPAHAVIRVVAYQALTVACAGAVLGTAAAVALTCTVAGVPAAPLFGASVIGLGIGTITALAASGSAVGDRLRMRRV